MLTPDDVFARANPSPITKIVGENTPYAAVLAVKKMGDKYNGYVRFYISAFNTNRGQLPWFTDQTETPEQAMLYAESHWNYLKVFATTVLELVAQKRLYAAPEDLILDDDDLTGLIK